MLFWMAVSVGINFCLNCYWYHLICKQVWRMVSRGTKTDQDFAGEAAPPTSEMHQLNEEREDSGDEQRK